VSFRESFIAGDSRAQRVKRMKNGGASVLRLSSPKAGRNRISALGHKRTFGKVRLMSALPPKADIQRHDEQCPLCAKSRLMLRYKIGRRNVLSRNYTVGACILEEHVATTAHMPALR
jgi:hypothetical protein